MDFILFLNYLRDNSMFSITIIFVSFVLGWLLYNNIILRKICLRDSLFEKDNLAAWIEFIGAFIFPTLYLGAKSLTISASENIFIDLLICTGYAVVYTLLFTVLRFISSVIVNFIGSEDHEGKVSLNNEIYKQKNISAALFSVTLSVVFVNMLKFLNLMPGYILTSVFQMLNIVVLTLCAFITYNMVLRRKTTLSKELFEDNNSAAGVDLLGFVFAIQTVLGGIAAQQVEFNFYELGVATLISLVLFGILSILFKWLFSRIVKVDIWNEVYEQNNIGAAIGQAALYIGIANVIIHFSLGAAI